MLHDYVADLWRVIYELDRPLVLVGYSLGGAVVQDYLRLGGAVAGAVLMNAVPPYGLAPSSFKLLCDDPQAWQQLAVANLKGVRNADPDILRRILFTEAVDDASYADFLRCTCDESPFVGMEVQGWRPIAPLPFMAPPMLALGGEKDRVVAPADIAATAFYYGVDPVSVPGMSHTMMLEPSWRQAFDPIDTWLDRTFAASTARAA